MTKKRRGSRNVFRQASDILSRQYHNGKSVSRAEMKAINQSVEFGKRKSPHIHSQVTFKKYSQTAKEFLSWCVNEKGIDKDASIKSLEPMAEEYLKYRNDSLMTKATIKTDRAGLGRLFNSTIPFNEEYKGSTVVTKGRGFAPRSERYSHKLNQELNLIAKATGGRRMDLNKLKRSDFKDINGSLYVTFKESKGGKDRTVPVLPEFEVEVRAFLEKFPPNDSLRFDLAKDPQENRKTKDKIVNDSANIHAFRREYAQRLYERVSNDSEYSAKLISDLSLPNRTDFPSERNIVSENYHSRKVDFVGKRDDIFLVSLALGHNRIDTSVVSYLSGV